MRMMKFVLYGCAALLLLGVLASSANAQAIKMGFIDDERIKAEYNAWAKAQEEFEIEAKAWEDEAVAKQEELRELRQEFERQKLILSEEKRKEREASIRAKEQALDAYTKQVFGPSGQAEQKQMSLIRPLLEHINLAIEAVAVEGNYDVIFTLQSGLGYIKETYDVTDRVLEWLEDNPR